MSQATLDQLVRQYLFARTEDMTPLQLAAFIDGWSSALEVIERTELTVPNAADAVRVEIRKMILEIRNAQKRALDDEFLESPT